MDDRMLLEKLKNDADEGIRELSRMYSALVAFILRGRLSGVLAEAEICELISDIFAEFYISIDKFDPERGSIKAYLCMMAKNIAADRYRDIVSRSRDISLDAEDTEAEDIASEFSVEEELLTTETREELLSAVKALGEPDTEIIIRRFYLSEPSKSIAESMKMTVSAVNTRCHRALQKLREALKDLIFTKE